MMWYIASKGLPLEEVPVMAILKKFREMVAVGRRAYTTAPVLATECTTVETNDLLRNRRLRVRM